MPGKRLVVCCDGTWNDPETCTNIWRLAQMLGDRGADGVLQRCYYVPGVGTTRFTRFSGGLFGRGLNDNIKKAYRWLSACYDPDDEIFCFGFSRGAYTARSLCGLIAAAGLLQRGDEAHVDTAFDYYRRPSKKRRGSPEEKKLGALPRHTGDDGLRIKMLGVFDTVGALGVPVPFLAGLTQWRRVAFHDTRLSPIIENALQALAVDEQRGPFRPTLWTGIARDADGNTVDQRVVQAWFAGVHADVGGGYECKRLANVPFSWMLAEAEALGLGVDRKKLDQALQPAPDPLGSAHDSLSRAYRLAAWWPWIDNNEPRVVGNDVRRQKGIKPLKVPDTLHTAVPERIRDTDFRLSPEQAPYRPKNICDARGEIFVGTKETETRQKLSRSRPAIAVGEH